MANLPHVYYTVDNVNDINILNEFKKDLIVWCQNQATGQRAQARISHTKRDSDKHQHKSESFDFVASYLQAININTDIKHDTKKSQENT